MNRFGIFMIFVSIACILSIIMFFLNRRYRFKNANIIQIPLLYFILGLTLIVAITYLPTIDYIADQYVSYRGASIAIVFLMILGYSTGLILINWFFACRIKINDDHLVIRTFFYKTYFVAFQDIKSTSYRLECICLKTEKKTFYVFEGCDGLRILLTILRNKGVPTEQLPANLRNDNASSIVIK